MSRRDESSNLGYETQVLRQAVERNAELVHRAMSGPVVNADLLRLLRQQERDIEASIERVKQARARSGQTTPGT